MNEPELSEINNLRHAESSMNFYCKNKRYGLKIMIEKSKYLYSYGIYLPAK